MFEVMNFPKNKKLFNMKVFFGQLNKLSISELLLSESLSVTLDILEKYRYLLFFCVLTLILLKKNCFLNVVMHKVSLIQTSVFYEFDENIDEKRQFCGWETLGLRFFLLLVIVISFFIEYTLIILEEKAQLVSKF